MLTTDLIRRFLSLRAAAVAIDVADPRFAPAHLAWLDAERAVMPHLTTVGVVVDDQRVRINRDREVVVVRCRKSKRAVATGPKVAKTAGMERAARIGGVAC